MGKRRRKYRRKSALRLKRKSLTSILSLFCFLGAIFTFLSFFGQAAGFGFKMQEYLNFSVGWGAFLIPFLLADLALIFYDYRRNRLATLPFFISLLVLTLSLISLVHFFFPERTAQTEAVLGQGGGVIGYTIQMVLKENISPFFTFLFLIALFMASIIILANTSLETLISKLAAMVSVLTRFWRERIFTFLQGIFQTARGKYVPEGGMENKETVNFMVGGTHEAEEEVKVKESVVEVLSPAFEPVHSLSDSAAVVSVPRIETVTNPPFSEKVWEYPPLSLLADGGKMKPDHARLNANAKIIEETLESFGVQAKVVEVNLGPAITQYALELTHGTKISKVTNLQHDLALALAAPTGAVRIEAPIPGKSLVGIEVPNTGLKLVNLKSILTSPAMQASSSVLSVALGEDVSGKALIADISRMPHVLIAGSTGSGKSVMINSIIATLLFRASPSEVKLILVDPKRVELSQYRDIPHLLTDVIVEPEKVVSALKWALSEMDRRYRLFEKAGVRNISGYNEVSGFQALPYIVIMIDELGDIIMTAPREVESAICRIAQLARATGIHLIIATQRPSVDILTGLIKANIPCRIAFNVSSMVDSRVIIDMPGAEKLLGKGDMLYVPPDSSKPSRIQGVFVSDHEIHGLIDFLRNSGFVPQYKEEIVEFVETNKMAGGPIHDELFEEAVALVVEEGAASTSLIQRKLKIGYNRAANIMEELEVRGVVGGQDGARKRDVLISDARQVTGGNHDEHKESWRDPSESSDREASHF